MWGRPERGKSYLGWLHWRDWEMLFDLKVIGTFEIEIHILASYSVSISEEAMALSCSCSGIHDSPLLDIVFSCSLLHGGTLVELILMNMLWYWLVKYDFYWIEVNLVLDSLTSLFYLWHFSCCIPFFFFFNILFWIPNLENLFFCYFVHWANWLFISC